MNLSDMQALLLEFGAVGLAGLFLGLTFKLPALAATSPIVAVALFVFCIMTGLPVAPAVMFTVCGLSVLQVCYLVGVGVNALQGRAYACPAIRSRALQPIHRNRKDDTR